MTETSDTIFHAMIFLLTGSTFLSMGKGHWVDWTKPVDYTKRFSVLVMAYLCLLEGFSLIAALIVGPYWSIALGAGITAFWIIYDRSL